METTVLIPIVILLLLSGIATFAYMMHNSAIYPYKINEPDEDEKIMKVFILIMTISLTILLIIIGVTLYEYCKIVF
jgi:predicted permease